MATNGVTGKGRVGEVKNRSQVKNPKTNLSVKRDTTSGEFIDNKTTGGKFKGVRTER